MTYELNLSCVGAGLVTPQPLVKQGETSCDRLAFYLECC